MPAIELTYLAKQFGRQRAAGNRSLSVPHGAICGIVGPNGSGKTTTLRMLVNIIRPDQGAPERAGAALVDWTVAT